MLALPAPAGRVSLAGFGGAFVPTPISVQEARRSVLATVAPLPGERVPLLQAVGRVLASPLVADLDLAPFDNSAMDGFAVRCADLAPATPEAPVWLRVVDHVAAGAVARLPVGPGEAIRIMTGAPLPEGAEAVVMVEHVRVEGDGGIGATVGFPGPAVAGQNIRRRGEDVRRGEVALPAGAVLNPAAIGLAAACGWPEVPVHRRPRVAVLSTGDELVEPHERPGPGQIRNSNTWALAAQVLDAGGVPVVIGTVRDTAAATREALLRGAGTDFIVASGGVSVGDFDYVRPVLDELGHTLFHRVDMRPGNPQTFGLVRGVPFMGLPGNPTSAFLGFELFVRPALRRMAGHTALDRPRVRATLATEARKRATENHYFRAILSRGEAGWRVLPAGGQSSALLSPAARANALMVLPRGQDRYPAGTEVECIRLDLPEDDL